MISKKFLVTWNMLFMYSVCDVGGLFIIKMHLNMQGPIALDSASAFLSYFISLLGHPLVILGLVMFLSAPILYTIALTRMDISTAYPVQVGLNLAILVLLAVIFLGEPLGFYKVLGLISIAASIFFLMEGHS